MSEKEFKLVSTQDNVIRNNVAEHYASTISDMLDLLSAIRLDL